MPTKRDQRLNQGILKLEKLIVKKEKEIESVKQQAKQRVGDLQKVIAKSKELLAAFRFKVLSEG